MGISQLALIDYPLISEKSPMLCYFWLPFGYLSQKKVLSLQSKEIKLTITTEYGT